MRSANIAASTTLLALSLTVLATAAPTLSQPISTAAQQSRSAARADLKDILATAAGSNFKTLLDAVEAAGLTETLKSGGSFTVFAPTDAAFAALPEGALAALLLPQNRAQLRALLAHHVVPGRLLSMEVANIEDAQMARTAGGGRETIRADREGFRYGGSRIVRADIPCTNGVLHAIDRVVLPKPTRSEDSLRLSLQEAAPVDLIAALRAVPDGRYSTFVAAVEASGGGQAWAQSEPDGNWTIFVPTNEAFARLSESERAALLDPRNREVLRAVLDWHALPKIQTWSFDLDGGERAPVMISQNEDRFVLDVIANGAVFVYKLRSSADRSLEEPFKARIVAGDIPVGGSVVHVIDRVMIPPQFENTLIASQAYPESEVTSFSRGADAQYNARYQVREMLARAESMGEETAVALYEFGLRILEEVVPVTRNGVIIMGNEMARDRATLRGRVQARLDDLDRVWYASFIANSPNAASLADPIPGATIRATAPEAVSPAAPGAEAPAPQTESSRSALRQTTTRARASATAEARLATAPLEWCEVIATDADPTIVTDAVLREAIAKSGLPWHVRDKTSGIEMLLVPAGQFLMGESAGDREALANEAPAHVVTIRQPYYLGRYEVTKEEWAKVLGSEGRSGAEPVEPGVERTELELGGGRTIAVSGGYELVDSQGAPVLTRQTAEVLPDGTVIFTTTPVDVDTGRATDTRRGLPINCTWNKAAEFCQRLGMRLPTEAEWEYACRAGVSAPRYGELDAIAWHRGNSNDRTHPVGTKAANALGLYDMLGNAWEWVNDWYGDYTRSAKTDPTGPESGKARIVRGSYFDYEDGFSRASRRYAIQSSDFAAGTGFRVARNP